MRLVLVRHGPTAWNREGRYHSVTDVPLAPDAAVELAGAARAVAAEPVTRVLTSPASRARDTAALLVRGLGEDVPHVVDADLAELGFGVFEGGTPPELATGEHSAAWLAWLGGADGGPAAPGGEHPAEAAVRADRVLARLATGANEPVAADAATLVVAHGYLLRIFVRRATGAPLTRLRDERWPNGRPVVLQRGDGGHGQDGSSSWAITSSRTSQPSG